jgi:hypothetical protein
VCMAPASGPGAAGPGSCVYGASNRARRGLAGSCSAPETEAVGSVQDAGLGTHFTDPARYREVRHKTPNYIRASAQYSTPELDSDDP